MTVPKVVHLTWAALAALGLGVGGAGCGGSDPNEGPSLADFAPADTQDVAPARWPGFPLLPDGRFPIAAWCAPPVAETTDERYAEYAAAGFTVVFPALEDPYLAESNLRRLDVAGRHGLWVFVRDDRLHPDEAFRRGWREDVDTVVAAYRGHPALLGYFMADEPRPPVFSSLAVIDDRLARLDPEHPAYVNLLGLPPRRDGIDGLAYSEYVDRFLRRVRPSFFSAAHYTLTEGGDTPNLDAGLDTLRQLAERHGAPFWAILQLTPHGRYRALRESEIRWQANLALAHGAKGLVWFTYWTPKPDEEWHYRDGPIGYDGRRNPLYDAVSAVNAEVEPLGRELARLEVVDVRHAGDVPPGGRPLDGSNGFAVPGDEKVTLGFFQDPGGGPRADRYVLVVNRDYLSSARVVLDAPAALETWRGTPENYGGASGRAVRGGAQVIVPLEPGGARLYRIR